MEIRGRLNLPPSTGLSHRSGLIRLAPAVAVRFDEDEFDTRPASSEPLEEFDPFVMQYDVTALPGFAGSDMKSAGVRIEVAALQRRELTEAAARRQRGPNQIAELALPCVDEAPAFIDRQIPDP